MRNKVAAMLLGGGSDVEVDGVWRDETAVVESRGDGGSRQ